MPSVPADRPVIAAALLWASAGAVAGWLGLACTALAYRLFVAGLRRLRPARVLALLCAQPVAAALLGVLLGERFSPPELAGMALMSCSALLHLQVQLPLPFTSKGDLSCPTEHSS